MNPKVMSVLMLAAFTLALSACASKSSTYSSTAYESEQQVAIQELETELQKKEMRLREFEEELQTKEASLAEKESQITAAATPTTDPATSLFPPNPKPGECYARVLIPGKYRTKKYQVLTREASERIEIVPAQYRTVEKRVLVREASEKLVKVPGQYKTVTERVIDKPAHTVWKKGTGVDSGTIISQKHSDTGEVMCLVEVPATYKTVTKQVLAAPATTKVVTIPAQYKTVKVTELVSPAREQRIEIPAQYKTVTKTEKILGEHLEWRQVVCKTNLTTSNVSKLQQQLKELGYYNDTVDGIFGPNTLKAANSFARAKNLPQGSNYIAMDVVGALGLKM